MTPKELIRKVQILDSARANWAVYWQDLANFCIPRKAFITQQRTPGEKLDFHRIFDNTAIRSVKIAGSGFHSQLTNPASVWFLIEMQDKKLMSRAVRVWLSKVEDEIFNTLNSSNFNQSIQEFYRQSIVFGTGVIFLEEDLKDRVRFTSVPISETYIEEDARGRVNRFYRWFEYTSLQAWERWGDRAGEEVKKNIEAGKFGEKLKFIHGVFPRDIREAGKEDSSNMPWESMWVAQEGQRLIASGGFVEFPAMVGRFNKETGERWGFSPAMDNLEDIKMINSIAKTLIRAAMKMTDPPFLVPSRGFIQPLNFNPAAANYFNSGASVDQFKPIETKGKFPVGLELLERYQKSVESGFFVPLFQALSQLTKQMTIPELQERLREMVNQLGPVVGRYEQEMYDPIIARTFGILARNGHIEEPPAEIRDKDFVIKYISPLARMQRQEEIVALDRTLVSVGNMASFAPAVLDKINADKAVDKIAEINGVDPELIRDDEEVGLIRQARAEAQEKQAQLDQMQQSANVAKTGAEAEKATRT